MARAKESVIRLQKPPHITHGIHNTKRVISDNAAQLKQYAACKGPHASIELNYTEFGSLYWLCYLAVTDAFPSFHHSICEFRPSTQ